VVAALQVVGLKGRLEPSRSRHAEALVRQGRWLEGMLGWRSPDSHA
jgi:hypothetical protein